MQVTQKSSDSKHTLFMLQAAKGHSKLTSIDIFMEEEWLLILGA